MLKIPLPKNQENNITQRTALDGRNYFLSFYWSARDEKYTLKVAKSNGDILISGVKLVPNLPLLRTVAWSADAPAGQLILLNPTNSDPIISNIEDSTLFYLTGDEVAEL